MFNFMFCFQVRPICRKLLLLSSALLRLLSLYHTDDPKLSMYIGISSTTRIMYALVTGSMPQVQKGQKEWYDCNLCYRQLTIIVT